MICWWFVVVLGEEQMEMVLLVLVECVICGCCELCDLWLWSGPLFIQI